ncbi:MAG: SH3 domain-containing protein [Anaerolineae bacterium]
MASDSRSKFGKLFAAGCGTQLGLLFSCGGLAAILLICSVCALSGALSVQIDSLAQEITRLYAPPPEEPAPAARAEAQPAVEPSPTGQAEGSLAADEAPLESAPDPPQIASPGLAPIVVANMGGVNLRSGPGTNYNRIGLLPHRESLEIVGRNRDSTWWLVSGPGGLAWVFDGVVDAQNVAAGVPVVTLPPPLFQPTPIPSPTPTPLASPTPTRSRPTPTRPAGTATAEASTHRIFVEDTVGFKELRKNLGAQPLSESFSPRGDQIAIIEGIKIHTVAGDGSYSHIWLEADEILRPVGSAVWSPDGRHIAFVVDYKDKKCKPCRSVGLLRLSDGKVRFLETPDDMDSEAPRWTQDGRLLVIVHPHEPADGVTYIYNTSGVGGRVATGTYILSSSHEGQKWLPWLPGRVWRAGVTERPDSYYN